MTEFFSLSNVRLLESPFKTAQDIDRAYLLKLEPDRLLAWFRREAGLDPKAPAYGGWEQTKLAGHSLGHYLTAISLLYAGTGETELKRRADYIVSELAECQQAQGGKFLCAFPNSKAVWSKLESGRVTDWGQSVWAPFYTIHKQLAGLLDAHTCCASARALAVARGLGDWVADVIGGLDEAQLQEMLMAEHGAIAESLANLHALTGDPRHLATAEKFRHDKFFVPFASGHDNLTDCHANTQIPKFIGYQRISELNGDATWHRAAKNFWNAVTRDRSYVNGSNSEREHFFDLDRFEEQMIGTVGAETCNSYNMLKLSEYLFQQRPAGAVMDYYERTLYNHILSSVRPDHDGFVYYTSTCPGSYRNYMSSFDHFYCCVGTGMENHVRYGRAIYSHDGAEKLQVNLFIPSTLEWKAAGLKLTQSGRFPDEPRTRLAFELAAPRDFTLSVRRPAWLDGEPRFLLNGEPLPPAPSRDGYVELARTWQDGDILEIELPMALHTEMLPHSSHYVAVLFGPLVLAGRLGPGLLAPSDFEASPSVEMDPLKRLPLSQTPVIVVPADEIVSRLRRTASPGLAFVSRDMIKPHDVTFVPFHQIHGESYAIYWRLTDRANWKQELLAAAAKEAAERDLLARTLDTVRPGEQQPETDHQLASEKSTTGHFHHRPWRDAGDGGWFSYALDTKEADCPLALVCKYWGSETGARTFDLQVDGTTLATENISGKDTGVFYDVTYPIPAALTKDKTAITVKFQAHPGNTAGGIFHIALVIAGPGAQTTSPAP